MNSKYNSEATINMQNDDVHQVIIIGAGLNGLAAAYELKKVGIDPLIVDGSGQSAEPWRGRHNDLRLNTHRLISHLPGLRIPRHYGAFPRRDDIIEYLEAYEHHFQFNIKRGVRVDHIDSVSDYWCLSTSSGTLKAHQVIVATGHECLPVIPDWPGRNTFTGEIIHAAKFGSAHRFDGKKILVVGAGNSGVDILNHLARENAAALWVSVRQGPTILPTRVFGIPLQLLSPVMSYLPTKAVDFMMSATERIFFGDLSEFGLSQHPDGVATRLIRENVAPAFDDGFIQALKGGRVKVAPAVTRFVDEEVVFADGKTIKPDVVICATGYRPGLESMVGHLGVLDDLGSPVYSGATSHSEHGGLWFMGMKPQLPGFFYGARVEARRLSKAIYSYQNALSATVNYPAFAHEVMGAERASG